MIIFTLISYTLAASFQPQFYISLTGVDPYATISNNLSLSWTSDTCAGAKNPNGALTTAVSPVAVNGVCIDGKNNILAVDPSLAFPHGFSSLSLQPFGVSPVINLLPTLTNNAALVGVLKTLTLNVASYPSSFYTIVMVATDVNGNVVRGSSTPFALSSNGVSPLLNSIQLWSPQNGSYWLAGGQYRIRFETLPNGLTPDLFNVDLMTVEDKPVARILNLAQPFANDDLFGTSHLLNYTVWNIPTSLTNHRFKLRITGVYSSGSDVVNVSSPPFAESGIFFIGPVKPTASTGHSLRFHLLFFPMLTLLLSL